MLRPTHKNCENIGRLEVEKRVGGPFADLQEHRKESKRTEVVLLPIERGLVACRSCPIKIFESVNAFYVTFRESEQPERWSKA